MQNKITVVENPKNLFELSFEQRKVQIESEKKHEKEEHEKEIKSPFNRFYQINKDKSEFLQSCLNENPNALKILLFIFDNMDNYNAVVCSYKVLEETLHLSNRTISRAIKYLKDNGFVYVYKSGTANVYVANKKLVWNSRGTNYKYCKFPANIILSKTEQENIKHKTQINTTKTNIVSIKNKK